MGCKHVLYAGVVSRYRVRHHVLYLVKKLIDALDDFFNGEEMMLERAYQEAQTELIEVRREYVTCVGEEQEIAELIARTRKQGKDTASMEMRLEAAREA